MPAVPSPNSLWVATGPATDYPRLHGDLKVDAAVIGAGITGLSAALLLSQAGLDVAVVERHRVGSGASGYTTAKLSSLHGLTYARLRSRFGAEVAHAYAQANEAGLERVAGWVDGLTIDCDLRRRSNYTYAASDGELEEIEAEVEAAREAGLEAAFVEDVPLPVDSPGAIRLDRQAEFHPTRYLAGLATELERTGGKIFEKARAVSVRDGAPCRIEVDGGELTAENVVIASQFPFPDRAFFFARMHAERSYALALRIEGAPPPGMFISASSPTRSIRAHPLGGEELLLVGGEGHKVGQGGPTAPRYQRLEEFARGHWNVASAEFRWSTQDNMSVDGLPFIGRLTPRSRGLYTATGYRKWGLAMGTAAAEMLVDKILGRDNPWASAFDANRFDPIPSAKDFVAENADVAFHFFADRVSRRAAAEAADLAPGEGRVVSKHGRQVALSRDEDGRQRAISARCTHLGCIVAWNDAERSWDCPCHGSRFGPDGEVLQGPATRPLSGRNLSA